MNISQMLGERVSLVSKEDVTVLLTGETGVGKSCLAKKIHEMSRRANGPFVTVNLASLHEGTLESELFGHEKGAFTGAWKSQIGRLVRADGGTVFLDEIGELSLAMQGKLLEFLQTKEVCPLGGDRPRKVDVRVIAATNKDLEEEVRQKRFRADLYFRLRVFCIHLPSLSERWDELDSITHDCLKEICQTHRKSILRISESFAREIEKYSWPGNIRELRNLLECAVLACQGQELTVADLPDWFWKATLSDSLELGSAESGFLGSIALPVSLDYYEAISCFEREYLKRVLQRFRGRVNLTARKTGMSKSTLIRRIRNYDLGVKIELQGAKKIVNPAKKELLIKDSFAR